MSDYDSPWKEALDELFEPFMAFFFPIAWAEIDWTRPYENLDKELQQVVREAEQGRKTVDKLVRVWRKSGAEEWVLVHVEVQSQEETEFAQRMFVCHYRLFDRYNRSVVSLAVLGDDRLGWRPSGFGYDLWGCGVRFWFPAVKLLDHAADVAALESNSNPFAIVVLAHLKTRETRKDDEARRVWKVRLLRGLHERGLEKKTIRQLLAIVDWMMNLPPALEAQVSNEISQLEEGKRMPYVTSFERIGERKGLLEGIKSCLLIKFGPAGPELMSTLDPFADGDALRHVLNVIIEATSLDDVRQELAKIRETSASKDDE